VRLLSGFGNGINGYVGGGNCKGLVAMALRFVGA
jgi:hypothetical protein